MSKVQYMASTAIYISGLFPVRFAHASALLAMMLIDAGH
jgi:hypothetical protein